MTYLYRRRSVGMRLDWLLIDCAGGRRRIAAQNLANRLLQRLRQHIGDKPQEEDQREQWQHGQPLAQLQIDHFRIRQTRADSRSAIGRWLLNLRSDPFHRSLEEA